MAWNRAVIPIIFSQGLYILVYLLKTPRVMEETKYHVILVVSDSLMGCAMSCPEYEVWMIKGHSHLSEITILWRTLVVCMEQLYLGWKEVSQPQSLRRIWAFSTKLLWLLSQWESTIKLTAGIRKGKKKKKSFKRLRISIYFGTDFLILLSSVIILSTLQLFSLLLKQYLLVGSGIKTVIASWKKGW